MNAHAGGDGRFGWTMARMPCLGAGLIVATFAAAVSRGEQVTFPDGTVVVGDQLGGTADTSSGVHTSGGMMGSPAFGEPVLESVAGQGPRWSLAVDAIMLWQGNAQSLPLILDADGATVFNSQQLGTEVAAGPRVSLIRSIGVCHAIEGNYFQANPFNAVVSVPPGVAPYTLTNMGDIVFDDIATANVTSSGSIKSAELNLRKSADYSPITWIAGFRWVELNSQINVDYAFANPEPFGSGSVTSASGNNLYGGQAGADVLLWNRGGTFRVNGIGKAGVFYNSAAYQQSSAGFVTSEGEPFPLGTVSAKADQTAFFGEVGVNATYWIMPWLGWRAGYTFLWASGVAVAAQQLPLNNFGDGVATINTNGSVLLHGVTTGFEARW